MEKEEIRAAVRKTYGQVARAGLNQSSNLCCNTEQSDLSSDKSSCGCGTKEMTPDQASALLGYSAKDLKQAPEGSNLGLGCGNPKAIASIMPGETVVDLGSGGGFDCFLAAKEVGETGQVIGVDMT
ncbi:MAG: methyltransferase domain-containing protein, partial [Desulfobacteraceae bacterium]|nr:methyltransferase domain-containing protein [Desulfobacteraceae bacterium]